MISKNYAYAYNSFRYYKPLIRKNISRKNNSKYHTIYQCTQKIVSHRTTSQTSFVSLSLIVHTVISRTNQIGNQWASLQNSIALYDCSLTWRELSPMNEKRDKTNAARQCFICAPFYCVFRFDITSTPANLHKHSSLRIQWIVFFIELERQQKIIVCRICDDGKAQCSNFAPSFLIMCPDWQAEWQERNQ